MKRKAKSARVKQSDGAGRDPAAEGLRIDRWLWYTRFFKTRVLASRAVAGGHIRRNGERAKPGDRVRIGDRLEIVREQERFEVEARGLPHRRGPAPEASACYLESETSARQRQEKNVLLKHDRMNMPRTDGRPDKHTRRLLRQRHRLSD